MCLACSLLVEIIFFGILTFEEPKSENAPIIHNMVYILKRNLIGSCEILTRDLSVSSLRLPWFIYYLFFAHNLCFFSLWWKNVQNAEKNDYIQRPVCKAFICWLKYTTLICQVFRWWWMLCWFSLSHVVNESFDGGEKSSHVLIKRLDHLILTYLCSSFIKTTTQYWFCNGLTVSNGIHHPN